MNEAFEDYHSSMVSNTAIAMTYIQPLISQGSPSNTLTLEDQRVIHAIQKVTHFDAGCPDENESSISLQFATEKLQAQGQNCFPMTLVPFEKIREMSEQEK